MPRLRALIASVLGGLLVFAVIGFWLRWPMFLSVTLAALLGVVFLMMAAALDDDGVAADVAWRAAAADLLGGDRVTASTEPEDPAAETDPAVTRDPAAVMNGEAAADPAGEPTSSPEAWADDRSGAGGRPDEAGYSEGEPILAPEPPGEALAPELVGPALRVESEAEP